MIPAVQRRLALAVHAKIGSTPVKLIIDTGSDCSFIWRDDIVGTPRMSTATFTGANGKCVTHSGVICTKMEMGGDEFRVNLYHIKRPVPHYDGLIGLDFLIRNVALIDVTKRWLQLNGIMYSLNYLSEEKSASTTSHVGLASRKHELSVVQDLPLRFNGATRLLKNSENIAFLKVPQFIPEGQVLYVEPSVSQVNRNNGVYIARCVTKCTIRKNKKVVPVRVMNINMCHIDIEHDTVATASTWDPHEETHMYNNACNMSKMSERHYDDVMLLNNENKIRNDLSNKMGVPEVIKVPDVIKVPGVPEVQEVPYVNIKENLSNFTTNENVNKKQVDLNTVVDTENETEKQQLIELLEEFPEIWHEQSSLPCTSYVQHNIPTGDSRPIYQKQYRLPQVYTQVVRDSTMEALRKGIIQESSSPWNSPVVVVPKKSNDGTVKHRMCLDLRPRTISVLRMTRENHTPMLARTPMKVSALNPVNIVPTSHSSSWSRS